MASIFDKPKTKRDDDDAFDLSGSLLHSLTSRILTQPSPCSFPRRRRWAGSGRDREHTPEVPPKLLERRAALKRSPSSPPLREHHMTSKKREQITAEAYEMLERLLVGHYGKPYEESHRILARKLEKKFRTKNTDVKYRSIFFDKVEDLVEAVIFRLACINSKSLREKGEMIRDPELMSYKIAELVYREERRKITSRLGDLPLDVHGEGMPLVLPQPAAAEAESILNEIIQACYDACVDILPAEARKVFTDYYPKVKLDPQELKARRRRLAYEQAGVGQTQSLTPEEEDRIINNLQSKVNKLKKNEIEKCVVSCTEDKSSRHMRLNFLSQQ